MAAVGTEPAIRLAQKAPPAAIVAEAARSTAVVLPMPAAADLTAVAVLTAVAADTTAKVRGVCP